MTRTAHHGMSVLRYTADDPGVLGVLGSLTVHGPATPNQGDSDKHRGMFTIDQTASTVSAQFQVSADQATWVQPYARYFDLDDTLLPIPMGRDPFGPAVQVQPGDDWTQVDLYGLARPGVSHWLLQLDMASDSSMSTPLADGDLVFYECWYVPDNGLDLEALAQPYLDGDQPKATWEGDARNSTSIYGPKPPSDLDQMVILDHDLLMPEPPE